MNLLLRSWRAFVCYWFHSGSWVAVDDGWPGAKGYPRRVYNCYRCSRRHVYVEIGGLEPPIHYSCEGLAVPKDGSEPWVSRSAA